MADSGVGGFVGGWMDAGQYQSQQQSAQDTHQQAMQDLATGNLKIQQTQQLLDAQHAAMLELAHQGTTSGQSGGKTAAGPDVGGVAGQAYKASELSFAAGDVYMKHGLVEQGAEFHQKAAKLAESGAALEVQQAEQQQRMWSHVGSALDTVEEGSPHASAEWDKLRMTFPMMFPEEAQHPEVQKFLQQSYDPKTVDLLKRASVSAQQQAELAKTKAQTKQADATSRFEAAGVGLRQAEAKEHSARADALGKAGVKPPPAAEVNNAKSMIAADQPDADPKSYQLYATEIAERAKTLMSAGQGRDEAFTTAFNELKDSGKLSSLPKKPDKKEAAASAARNDLVDDIDDLISDMEANPGAAGGRGKLARAGEFLSTATGIGDQSTPMTSIVSKAQQIQLKIPKALTGASKSAKDERDLVSSISDITRLGTSDATAIAKLKAVRDRLAGKQTIAGKGAKAAAEPSFTNESEVGAALDAGKIKKGDVIIYNGQRMKVQ